MPPLWKRFRHHWFHALIKPVNFRSFWVLCRTVSRKPSPRGLYVRVGGALRLCRGGFILKIWQKLQWFIVFHITIWGAKPTKAPPPWRRVWFCAFFYFRFWFVSFMAATATFRHTLAALCWSNNTEAQVLKRRATRTSALPKRDIANWIW